MNKSNIGRIGSLLSFKLRTLRAIIAIHSAYAGCCIFRLVGVGRHIIARSAVGRRPAFGNHGIAVHARGGKGILFQSGYSRSG
jgi:hypothetical protein